MIKAEKTGSKIKVELIGDTHELTYEFKIVLKAMHEMLEKKPCEIIPIHSGRSIAHNGA